jgi:predicted Zn-dependent protease
MPQNLRPSIGSRYSRAAVLAALFIFGGPASGQAQTKAKIKKSETYQDIIEKSQNLILQKDRQQAVNILINAIRREGPKSAGAAELKKTLNEATTLFLSDKAQQIYEVGVTLKRTDIGQAQQKMAEGLKLEPDNLLFWIEQARVQIAKGDCSGADDTATKARAQNPYYEELNLVQAQASLCLNKILDYQKIVEAQDIKKSSFAKFWSLMEAEHLWKEKSFLKSQELAAQVKKMDAGYPEVEYWLWKNDQSLKKKNPVEAEKYVMACKNISAHLFRQYMIDPMLCRRVAETETSGNE